MVTVARHACLSNAGALFLKLVALAAMVADHVDWLLLDGATGFHATWGRMVFPAFALVLAYNLERIQSPGKLRDLCSRMGWVGCIASVPYVYLQGTFLPLNVMFTLAASVFVVALLRGRRPTFAALVALGAGLLVDYNWFGIAAVVGAWAVLRGGYGLPMAALVVVALTCAVNLSPWPLLLLPMLAIALRLPGDSPRLKWLFYAVYPAHLAVLAVIHAT